MPGTLSNLKVAYDLQTDDMSLGDSLQIVTMKDLGFTYAGLDDRCFQGGLNRERKREACTVRQVDQDFGSVSSVLIDTQNLDGLSRYLGTLNVVVRHDC
jgi:hypothetical protein